MWNSWDSLTNHCFLALGRKNKNFWDMIYFSNGRKKIFGLNGWKAAQLLDRLLSTEWHHFHSLYGRVKYIMPIFLNSPTRLASRGIIIHFWPDQTIWYFNDFWLKFWMLLLTYLLKKPPMIYLNKTWICFELCINWLHNVPHVRFTHNFQLITNN